MGSLRRLALVREVAKDGGRLGRGQPRRGAACC
jgi:hypothetical protein